MTLDWDMYPQATIDGLMGRIEKDAEVVRAWVRHSSFKGHHALLEIRVDDSDLRWILRADYADDSNRLGHDLSRNHPEGVLFDWKRGRYATHWERFK